MQLHAVILAKVDTCLTYALKRAGHSFLLEALKDSADVELFFDMVPFEQFTDLKVGDILVYTDNERWAIMPAEITADGRIVSHRHLILRHFAVWEGKDMISDATISSRDYPFCKTIRMQRYQQANTVPSFVLQLKST